MFDQPPATTSYKQEHRGHTIDADTNGAGQWVPIIDGDVAGASTFYSGRDAIRRARQLVDRREGITRARREHPELVDDDYFAGLRDALRGNE